MRRTKKRKHSVWICLYVTVSNISPWWSIFCQYHRTICLSSVLYINITCSILTNVTHSNFPYQWIFYSIFFLSVYFRLKVLCVFLFKIYYFVMCACLRIVCSPPPNFYLISLEFWWIYMIIFYAPTCLFHFDSHYSTNYIVLLNPFIVNYLLVLA